MSILIESYLDKAQLKIAGIIYVQEDPLGIKRRKCGKGFSYIDKNGELIRDKQERARLQSIAVPPTYNEVWYCPLPNGHLQATGIDSTLKKQYFYHSGWDQLRDNCKFNLMIHFAEKLPVIRRRVAGLLNSESREKETVIAAMVRILDATGMRIGSSSSTEKNDTYGLTTLTKSHVHTEGDELWLEYDGKGRVHQQNLISDDKVVALIQECVEIPGQTLFQYEKDGEFFKIDSADVNHFIKQHMGENFSAKDFRTWRFSSLFLSEVFKQQAGDDTANIKVSLTSVLNTVSEQTGNTPAILKSSYIHPALLNLVKDKKWELLDFDPEENRGLRKVERILLQFLRQDCV